METSELKTPGQSAGVAAVCWGQMGAPSSKSWDWENKAYATSSGDNGETNCAALPSKSNRRVQDLTDRT